MRHVLMFATVGWLFFGQTRSDQDIYRSWSLPDWVQNVLGSTTFSGKYELDFRVNPYYQRGDFDGDRIPDIAVLIHERSTHKTGIAFVHHGSKSWHVVGAGSRVGNGGDDFSWLAVWRVEPASALVEIRGFRSEVLYVEKPESASALLYWDGKRYQWVQRGD